MIAQSWADIPAGCTCGWSATGSGPWSRVTPNPRCRAVHEEDGYS